MEAVEAAYSLNKPSDEQRPFYGGSSRMEIKNVTLWIKPAFKIVVQNFGANSYGHTGNAVTKRQTGQL